LRDPSGAIIDQNSSNASFASYPNLVYALIPDPKPGDWLVEVFGREISQPNEPFNIIMSARAAPPTPIPPPVTPTLETSTPTPILPSIYSGGGFPVALILLFVGGGIVALYTYATVLNRRRGAAHPAAPAGSLIAASLTIVNGAQSGQVFSCTRDSITIGRAAGKHIRITDKSISRFHAVLRYAQGSWYVQDQKSTAGTFVNGQRVEAARLNNGDRIRIGFIDLVFLIPPG
jgi:hypothetical protein